MPTVTRSNETPYAKTGEYVARDAKAAHSEVKDATYRAHSRFSDLRKIAKAFIRWDEGAADKGVVRELQNFISMPLSAENCTWMNESAMRSVFARVLVSSAENDPSAEQDTEKQATEYRRNPAVRSAFRAAISIGASDEAVQRVLRSIDSIGDKEPTEVGYES